jgi:aminoglycoside phosphotransferase (APT) family kinase protein
MNMPQNYADTDTARAIAHKLYPNAQKITMIEHSHDNIVALIDTRFAVRFPRNGNAYLRALYEKHILKKLEGVDTLAIPRILSEYSNPPYFVTSFMRGHHISAADVRTFTQDQQQEFAWQVAQFAYTMHTAFTLDEELPLRKELGLDELAEEEPWPIYFKRVVHDVTFPTRKQDEIAKKYYGEWMRLCNVPATVVIHDDLHTQNMMFEGSRLIGVLDFGDANLGTPEQELRQLYRVSEKVMLAGAREYHRLSGKKLDVDALKNWCIMKEIADYYGHFTNQTTGHHAFRRACRNLNDWLPEGEWGKGYDLSSSAESQ